MRFPYQHDLGESSTPQGVLVLTLRGFGCDPPPVSRRVPDVAVVRSAVAFRLPLLHDGVLRHSIKDNRQDPGEKVLAIENGVAPDGLVCCWLPIRGFESSLTLLLQPLAHLPRLRLPRVRCGSVFHRFLTFD